MKIGFCSKNDPKQEIIYSEEYKGKINKYKLTKHFSQIKKLSIKKFNELYSIIKK